ncbi:DUF1552 domain-containing protein [Planctobacterium marinum]|uniref:Tat (Twin-arginine translocation) pathway signal sequence domain protein n=1 Tax=Planctobacterium marinum TaxID=1631968 RepID=A0AA48KSK8_9ALTE|nr:hypothetical protein MACH26_21100 [Planctobacterium marinum]
MKQAKFRSNIFNRRDLLKSMAATGITQTLLRASPLMAGILHARNVEAQASSTPDKTVAIYIPGGGVHRLWAPSGSGEDMVMAPMSAAYDSVKTECNFLLNMSHANAGHGRMPVVLANSWGGDSYDVVMGRALGPALPFTYVNLGVHSNGQGALTKDNRNQIPFEDNPFTAFRLLFGNVNANPKTSILDAHAEAANAIKTKLAGYETQRLDDHLDAISDTQRRLDDLSGGSTCSIAPDATEFTLSHDTFTQQAHLQADIAVAALSCNLTSSISIGFGNHQSEFRLPGLNYQGIYHQSIHGGSNGQANYPYYVEMRNHLGSFTAYLINKLRAAGILDSTVVVETTDMGHADLHSNSDVPLMIAGGGSAINRGVTTAAGSSYDHWDLLHTAAKACNVDLGYGKEIPGVLT